MPSYDASPFANPVQTLSEGMPAYLFGSYNQDVSPTRFQISQVQIASNVATLTGTVLQGNIPAVGSLISVRGTATGAGEFNVTNQAITAVSITASTGVGTIQFALTGSNVGPVADGGVAIIPQPEVGETLAAGASIPATLAYNDPTTTGSRTVKAQVTFPTAPTTVTVTVESATVNVDSQFITLGTVVNAANAGNILAVTIDNGKFYRFRVSSLTGSGTIVAKLLV